MTAYIIVDAAPIDQEKLSEYSAQAAATLIEFEGEFIAKGPINRIHGDSEFVMKVMIRFPDKERAESWYRSASYQALIPLREQAMRSRFELIA